MNVERATVDEALSVDLVDSRQNVQVWQGVATGSTARRAQQKPDAHMDEAVSELFMGFPMNTQGGNLTSALASAQ